MKRRESLEIVKGLLDYLVEPNSLTHIMRKNNLSFFQVNSYLNALVKAGYLEKIEKPNKDKTKAVYQPIKNKTKFKGNFKCIYKTTEEGLEALENIKNTVEILNNIKKHL
ncbi:MAG: winged helix-turn-helix domain-containing protein [Candidatus Aenigmatarchaeota archaeon]